MFVGKRAYGKTTEKEADPETNPLKPGGIPEWQLQFEKGKEIPDIYSEKILQLHYAPQVFAYSMYRTRHKTQENNLHLPTHCRRCLNPLYPEEQKLYTTILFECTSQMSGDISLNMLRTESREVLFSIGCFGLWPCVYARAVCDKCIVLLEKFKRSLWPALDPALLVLLPAFLPCGADVIRIIGMYAFHREITYAVV